MKKVSMCLILMFLLVACSNGKSDSLGSEDQSPRNVYNALRLENEVDPKDGKVIFSDIYYSKWKLENGEQMTFQYDEGGFTLDVQSYKEHFLHNNKDKLTWYYLDGSQKNFYYEIDEENMSINLWYHYGDKTDPAQQQPHVIINLLEYSAESIKFRSETFWLPNIQFIKDGEYSASRIDFNVESKRAWDERNEVIEGMYKNP